MYDFTDQTIVSILRNPMWRCPADGNEELRREADDVDTKYLRKTPLGDSDRRKEMVEAVWDLS